MGTLRAIRGQVKRADFLVTVVTAILGIYLAAGGLLLGTETPNEAFWMPWRVPFDILLASAIYVPIYGFYKALDAHFEAQDRLQAVAYSDLLILCQQVTALIVAQCPKVSLNQTAVQIWACEDDGSFDPRARFFLPHRRKNSGIVWRKGKGVAGTAWEQNCDYAIDLRPLHRLRQTLGKARFNELPPRDRYGMSFEELESSQHYRGVAAIRLFSTDGKSKLLGIFLIDYTGDDDGFECIEHMKDNWEFRAILGTCETVLTAPTQGD